MCGPNAVSRSQEPSTGDSCLLNWLRSCLGKWNWHVRFSFQKEMEMRSSYCESHNLRGITRIQPKFLVGSSTNVRIVCSCDRSLECSCSLQWREYICRRVSQSSDDTAAPVIVPVFNLESILLRLGFRTTQCINKFQIKQKKIIWSFSKGDNDTTETKVFRHEQRYAWKKGRDNVE